MNKISIIIFLLYVSISTLAQPRWHKSYLEDEDPFAKSVINTYDNGYFLMGKYGPNYTPFNWLIKTDINGEVLWNKVIGDLNSVITLTDLVLDQFGCLYLSGSTRYYSDDGDPLIMKIDACGEKVWCKVFLEEGSNYVSAMEKTNDESIIAVLHYMNPDITRDRICLAKLTFEGELIWKQCYNSDDSCIINQDAYDLLVSPDKGFLITGVCQYQEADPPHAFRSKPYYIKTDSMGNFEWETVAHKGLKSPGGYAGSTILNNDSSAYYSSLAHKYYDPFSYKAALLKMGLNGAIDTIYDLNTNDNVISLYGIELINDSLIMGAATWDFGNTDDRRAVIIDTLGDIVNYAHIIDDIYTTKTNVTYDNKLLYLTSTVDNNNNFSTYLFKLNQQLESDTIYSASFLYDSLCSFQIESDTIVQDNCGLIVGFEDIQYNRNKSNDRLLVYPNPARESFTIEIDNYQSNESSLHIYDIQGEKVKTINISENEKKIQLNVKDWKKGLYVIRIYYENGNVDSGKIMVK